MLDKKDIDGYWTSVSGQAPSNNDLKELIIWFDCLRESLSSLPESSHLKNDIISNRILLLEKLTLSLPRSSINDLVFSVLTSNFFKLSYKISLRKNRFVTLFFIRFS